MSAIAISNNDVAFLAWRLEAKIPQCLGFAVYRKDATGAETPLPAWVGFQGQSNSGWKANTTAEWPVQKFTWRDLTAKRGETYTYRIVPMVGAPGSLKAQTAAALTTEAVTITEQCGDLSAFFNRGILSTQSLSHQLPNGQNGSPSFTELMGRIDQPGDPLRNSLSGQLREAMLNLFAHAKSEGGQLYCALYELTDPELEQQLLAAKSFVHVILSNTGVDDKENTPARQALHEAGIDITDRKVASGHIGHNKFAVYVNRNGQAEAVWTGSTNWTETALCAQSNNGVLIEAPELAKLYLDYWNRLKKDDSQQGLDFRAENDQQHKIQLKDGAEASLWFSPNTKQKSKSKEAKEPDDLSEVFQVMQNAKQAILFLVFQPGEPSVVDEAGKIQDAKPDLFVHGAATDQKAVNYFNTQLFHKSGHDADTDLVTAAAIHDQFGYWERELLKSSPGAHAIIHDKIVVVDPFSPDCVVITGSHNLGYRASYNNDENLLIVRGNSLLAKAYTAHVMDIYDHYRWRFLLQQKGNQAWNGLVTNDSWQDKYFVPNSLNARELDFWIPQNGGAKVQVKKAGAGAEARSHQPAHVKKAAQPSKTEMGKKRLSR